MPTPPRPLPYPLGDGPFLVRDGYRAGLRRSRLRAAALDSSIWGVRDSAPLVGLPRRCAALAVRMPPLAVFSHVTAALLHGIPVPWRLASDPSLHVSVAAPRRAPHATGIRGHQLRLTDGDVVSIDGVRVTSVERTWFDLAVILSRHELVAAGDFAIHHRLPLTSVERLAEYVETTPARRGTARRAAALEHLDSHSESPPESVLRMILIDAGAPRIRVNHPVTDRFGLFVARTDLIIDEWKLILEYQGDHHRTMKGQWRADMTRRSRLEAEGWRVMEINADDLRHPEELVQRILRRVALAD